MAAEALDISEARARMQSVLVRLAENPSAPASAGGTRLLAVARAFDSQISNWQRTTERLTTSLTELSERSGQAEEETRRELGLLQSYVLEQTKSYLASAASRAGPVPAAIVVVMAPIGSTLKCLTKVGQFR